jgi:hypothetical protein
MLQFYAGITWFQNLFLISGVICYRNIFSTQYRSGTKFSFVPVSFVKQTSKITKLKKWYDCEELHCQLCNIAERLRQFCENSFLKCLLFHCSGFAQNQKLLLENIGTSLKNEMWCCSNRMFSPAVGNDTFLNFAGFDQPAFCSNIVFWWKRDLRLANIYYLNILHRLM